MFLSQEKSLNSDIPTAFNEYFVGNFNFNSYDGSISTYGDLKLDSVLDFVSSSSITYEVMSTKKSTVSTFHGFPNKVLVRAPVLFGIIFSPLFCSIILCKVFPSVWKVVRITLVFKSRSRNSIMCYRPINLLPKISLIFEKLLFRFLLWNLKSKLHPKQFGFQSQKISVLQLVDYMECVYHEKSRNRFSVLFDYQKAFEKVPQSILPRKLSLYLDYYFCSLFESYLMNRYQYVHVNDFSSDLLPCVLSGVPQGSVFGLFWF